MSDEQVFKMSLPESKKMKDIEAGFSDLIRLANQLESNKNQLMLHSSLNIHSELNQEHKYLLRKFEKKMTSWREIANDLYGKPDGLKVEKGTDAEVSTSIIHFLNAIFMMISEINFVYRNILNEYRAVVNSVRTRQALALGSISIAISILFTFAF